MPAFFSKYESLNSCGVDLFSQSLDYEEFYFVFLPVSLTLQVWRFLDSQQVKWVFIIPLWPTSVWFNSIFHDGYTVLSGLKSWYFSVIPVFTNAYNWLLEIVVFIIFIIKYFAEVISRFNYYASL